MGNNTLSAYTATSGFVLLWGIGAIFTYWGLENSSAMLLLIFRFSLALMLLVLIGIFRRKLWPEQGTVNQVLLTGLLMVGGYSVCYFQAMAYGVTPGLIATIMGIQPILTLCILEKHHLNKTKLLGLSIALMGLITLVWESLSNTHIAPLGMFLAIMALLCITFGSILQKKIKQHPAEILPLQYAIGLCVCVLLLPFENIHLNINLHFIVSVVFLGILISVIAQILLYRLLHKGNVVNVTSLFYLVPVITALLDYAILGHTLPWSGLIGMIAILIGVFLVFKTQSSYQIKNNINKTAT